VVTVARACPSPKGLGTLDGPGALDGLMLDIGGDTGALVVLVDEPLDGSEIEVVGVRGHAHAQVHRRRSGAGGDVYAAVFVAVEEGSHVIELPGDRRSRTIQVVGGSVTTSDLRKAIGSGRPIQGG
jgi:hypothetical protein